MLQVMAAAFLTVLPIYEARGEALPVPVSVEIAGHLQTGGLTVVVQAKASVGTEAPLEDVRAVVRNGESAVLKLPSCAKTRPF